MRNRLMQRAALGAAATLLAGGAVMAGSGTASAAPVDDRGSAAASVSIAYGGFDSHGRGHHGNKGRHCSCGFSKHGHHKKFHGLGILKLLHWIL
ncbi:hypothetical protein AB0C96_08755 [Streptomyces sp. NPDC048506]|uniref:hypothetical protein n=1 Tax=Streptomyces sp. NPDC048506 TaxID=3155028 RepID=UPI00344571CB